MPDTETASGRKSGCVLVEQAPCKGQSLPLLACSGGAWGPSASDLREP